MTQPPRATSYVEQVYCKTCRTIYPVEVKYDQYGKQEILFDHRCSGQAQSLLDEFF